MRYAYSTGLLTTSFKSSLSTQLNVESQRIATLSNQFPSPTFLSIVNPSKSRPFLSHDNSILSEDNWVAWSVSGVHKLRSLRGSYGLSHTRFASSHANNRIIKMIIFFIQFAATVSFVDIFHDNI